MRYLGFRIKEEGEDILIDVQTMNTEDVELIKHARENGKDVYAIVYDNGAIEEQKIE